jgi:hypothetical protein
VSDYVVAWTIDVEADDPWAAANEARKIQLDPESTATIFTVRERNAKHPVDIDIEVAE